MDYMLLIIYFVFATLVFGIYKCVKNEKRYIVLLVFSVISVAIYSKFLALFVCATAISVYFGGIVISKINVRQSESLSACDLDKESKKQIKQSFKKKRSLVVAVVVLFNLAILATLKYSGFFASIFEGLFSIFKVTINCPVLKIGLPIGISYYTLTALGYVIDVGRGKYPAERNFFKVALFVFYFPSLFEGPFSRYDELMPQFSMGGDYQKANIGHGIILAFLGLFKKLCIADRFGMIANAVFSDFNSYSGIMIVVGVIAFTVQLYAEFSGFIDMASGISEMFGIKLATNFKQPFFSQNVGEFWRRWHITLGAWFKDYVFYPVSMSKPMVKLNKKLQGKVSCNVQILIPSAIALLVVWFGTGLWHGASIKYVVYGLYYYLLMLVTLITEPLFNSLYAKMKIKPQNTGLKIFRIIRTFILVNIGMLLFRANTIGEAFTMIGKTFSLKGSLGMLDAIALHELIVALVGLAVLIVMDSINFFKCDLGEVVSKSSYKVQFTLVVLLLFAVLIFGAWGVGYTVIDPIYGGF